MANIIGLQEQQRALKEIQDILKDLAALNTFLSAQNPTGVYSITFSDEEGKKHKAELPAVKEEIAALAARYKKDKSDYVRKLASDKRIALDLEDEEILGN